MSESWIANVIIESHFAQLFTIYFYTFPPELSIANMGADLILLSSANFPQGKFTKKVLSNDAGWMEVGGA